MPPPCAGVYIKCTSPPSASIDASALRRLHVDRDARPRTPLLRHLPGTQAQPQQRVLLQLAPLRRAHLLSVLWLFRGTPRRCRRHRLARRAVQLLLQLRLLRPRLKLLQGRPPPCFLLELPLPPCLLELLLVQPRLVERVSVAGRAAAARAHSMASIVDAAAASGMPADGS
eukprot:6755788-Prymnesium_polylepis.2